MGFKRDGVIKACVALSLIVSGYALADFIKNLPESDETPKKSLEASEKENKEPPVKEIV